MSGKEFKEQIKTAVFIGISAGVLFGLIDCLARILAFSFEWFNFYQTILIHSVMFGAFFTVIALVIYPFVTNKKRMELFYVATATAIGSFYYIGVLVTRYIIDTKPFSWTPERITASLIIGVAILIIYVVVLIKVKKLPSIGGRKVINNILFFVAVFVAVSFVGDIQIVNMMPDTTCINSRISDCSGVDMDSPNILFIVMDTVNAKHMSLYGYDRDTTPNLNKFSENAVVFENAIAPNSWSLPSHTSFFTGRYVSTHGTTKLNQLISYDELTIAEILRDNGYNTIGIVANTYCKAKYGIAQGFNYYYDRVDFFETAMSFDRFSFLNIINQFYPDVQKLLGNDEDNTVEEMNQKISMWLNNNKEQPFYMFLNYIDPHEPYNTGLEFRSLFTDTNVTYDEVKPIYRGQEFSEEGLQDMIAFYDTEIYYLDYYMGELFDMLEDQGLMDNTIIVITSDHGEEFYEHGGFAHGKTLYEEVLRVPLIVYYPERFAPQRIETRVSLTDTFSMILDMVDIPEPENIDSVSLVPLIENGTYAREYVISELFGYEWEGYQQIAVYKGDFKMIMTLNESNDLSYLMFDLLYDPDEKIDIYEDLMKRVEE